MQRAAIGGDRMVRSALFLATFLLIWLTPTPFPDLSDPKLLEPVGEGNFFGQALAILLTASLAAFVFVKDKRLVFKALTPMLVLTLLWFTLSAVASAHPALASRRLVLAIFTIFQAAVLLLLPQDRDHFGRLLAASALIILAICYAGIIFAPELSIHQINDLVEPDLAGDWRGAFGHKNGAGAAMVMLIFIGIFVVRSLSPVTGALIIVLAGIFLVFTDSKSPIRLLPFILVVSLLVARVRRPSAKVALAVGFPLIINIFAIGSILSDSIATLAGGFVSDPTFTGRDAIWRFTLDHIAQRPFLGFGFQAFWGTSDLLAAWSYLESWGYRASDAHNSYLNIAVMTGVVGLVLSMLWTVVQALADYIRTQSGSCDRALNMLLMQAWLFGLCISSFESVLFDGGNLLWFMLLIAIVGFRYQVMAQLSR
jgi:O-antigen ligase